MDNKRSDELNFVGQAVVVVGIIAAAAGIIGIAAASIEPVIAGSAIGAGVFAAIIGELLKGFAVVVRASETYLSDRIDPDPDPSDTHK